MTAKVRGPLDLYVRVSRVAGREGASFIAPELQTERCRALAQARGLQVGEVLTDLGQSGGKMERAALDEGIERIRQGISSGLIVARLDRFSRTLVGGLQTPAEIEAAGGVVLDASGDFDTSTPTGRLVLRMMLSLAEFELDRIRENWSVAQRKFVARGGHGGSKVPTGYLRNDDGALSVDPVLGPLVREVFLRRASEDS